MTLWKDYLLDYETKHWELPPWEIIRQGDSSVAYQAYSENFLFTYGQAAFVSINLGSGEVYSETESQQRHDANLVWIDSAYDFYSKQVSTIFILADDGPPGVSQNTQFYVELLALIESDYKDVEFVLVHRGSSSWGYTEKYGGINNLDVVEVLGPIWPPLRMTVDFGQTKPRITLEDSWN